MDRSVDLAGPEYRLARGWAEGQGIPTTHRLMTAATRVVKNMINRRATDKLISDNQLEREVVRAQITALGNEEGVRICLENHRLRAFRMPTNPEMPTNPSVEDLCEYVLLHHLIRLAQHVTKYQGHQAALEANDDD